MVADGVIDGLTAKKRVDGGKSSCIQQQITSKWLTLKTLANLPLFYYSKSHEMLE